MTIEPQSSVEALLERMDRVRALARRLVRDAAEADELVQEAVTIALQRPRSVVDPGDSWIKATLGNLMRDRRRRAAARTARERAAARPEGGGEDTRLVLETAERQREIVEAVLALDEPYREAILLRYFEGLPPRAIVKRTGRSPETVKKHLARGLGQLRTKLESRYGDRGRWAVAILPATGARRLGGLTGSGAALKGLAGLGAAAAVGTLALALRDGGAPQASAPRAMLQPPTQDSSAPPDLAAVDREQASTNSRIAEIRGQRSATEAGPRAKGKRLFQDITVVLIDLAGQPFADREVQWTWYPSSSGIRHIRHGKPDVVAVGRTDTQGRVNLRGPGAPAFDRNPWSVDGRPYTVIGEFPLQGTRELVLAPTVRLSGQVLDSAGNEVMDAQVEVTGTLDALADFPFRMDVALRGFTRTARTDASGRFTFERVPSHPAFSIQASRGEQAGQAMPLPPGDVDGLVLRVEQEAPTRRMIEGLVLGPTGEPAAGARIAFGPYLRLAEADGRFQVLVPPAPESHSVIACDVYGNFVAVPSPVRSDQVAITDVEGVALDAVVLQLPDSMMELNGQLVRHDGRPAAGFHVQVLDGTVDPMRGHAFELGGGWDPVRTDAEGRFTLDHCHDRSYHLRFVDPRTMLVHDATGLTPDGHEHVISLPESGLVDRLEGQVLDLLGDPVAHAQVHLSTPRVAAGKLAPPEFGGRLVTTDAEGRFRMEGAPWRHLSLVVEVRPGSKSRQAVVPLGEAAPDEPLVLRVDLDCRVHVIAPDAQVERVELLDDLGRPIETTIVESGRRRPARHVRRTANGHLPVFEVSQRATMLVAYGAGVELTRQPLQLHPSVQNQIEL